MTTPIPDTTAAPAAAAPAAALSALATGATPATATDGQAASALQHGDSRDFIPEKYRVLKGETLDLDASARKLAEGYTALSKRLGGGDLPPKTVEEYQIEGLPEAVNLEDLKADPQMKTFLKSAHGKGLTNAQVSFVLNEYLRLAPELLSGGKALSTQEATTELRKAWKGEDEFKQNIGAAYRAFQAFADPADRERIDEIGNNPLIVRMLAKVGREMAEDQPIAANSVQARTWEAEVAAIKGHAAYMDATHPEHKVMVDKLQTLYAKRYGSKPQRLGGGVNFSTAA